jgi:hypothetical protein
MGEGALPVFGFVVPDTDEHDLVEVCAPRDGCFIDDEFDGGVAVQTLYVVSIPHAHERIAKAAREFQCAGLCGRHAFDDMGFGVHAFHIERNIWRELVARVVGHGGLASAGVALRVPLSAERLRGP